MPTVTMAQIRIVSMLCACSFLTACIASDKKPDAILTGEVFSVSCERAWMDCYTEARRRCVGGDFEEIDRNALERTTVDNPSYENPNAQSQATYRAMTMRCK